ncbi:MAG TPA: CPBP family intramembrane glutamic endopeptidase [Candidatus Dormibacteraeota bacterium]|nr:CPBP family intramembrane glutamic endopeptidase [Candidatus Dormibacteraeota bacterium]
MSSACPGGTSLASTGVVLGAASQAGLSYLSFRYPRYFWVLMTLGLSACGLPGLRRLRAEPQRASVRGLGLGVLAGVAGYGITAAGAAVARRWPFGRRSLDRLRECSQSVPRPVAALLVVPAAVGEELFWRESVLGRQLQPKVDSQFRRLASSTLAYAAVQAGSLQPLPPLGALLLGAGAGWIRLRSGSIWPAVAAHLAYSELALVAPGLPGTGSKPRK